MISPDPNVGKVLQGRYRILEQVASGGMGVVYRGERVGLSRPVAIKFVWPAIARVEQARKRFEIEAQAMSRLSHPSCVGVIDFGVEDGAPYLVMDFATGRTLKAALEAGRLPVAQALHIARQLLGGLAHAHGQGIIHRDIKPDNIVLSETEGFGAQVRILDFGLAKLKDSVSGMTVGFAIGTPRYMSPEQTLGEPVDVRTDIYAVGILLFEMLTGTLPFEADKVPELLRMQRELAPPTLGKRALDVGFSAALETVVAKAIAKAPAARFTSAADFAAALDATPEATTPPRRPATGEETVSARRVVQPSRSKRRWIIPSAAAAVVGLVGVALWIGARPQPAPVPPAAALLQPPVERSVPAPVAAPAADGVRVPGLDEAEALLHAGRSSAALDALRKLHVKYPEDARVAYLLGNIYFDRMWWNDGFDCYRVAVNRNPAYRQDPVLISNVAKSFVSDRYASTGARFIEREIGSAAIPVLQEAARSKSLNVRSHAVRLLAKLQR